MAEVGQRLGSGGYRLSAFTHSQGRAVSTGDSPGSLLFNRTFTNRRFKEQSTRHPHEVQPRSRATRRRPEKLLRVRSSETLRCTTCLDLDSSRFFSESLQHTAALYLSARLQPLLQEQLLHGRMSPWTRGAVSTHPDTFRFPQQLRAFCTVLFMLAEQRSERPKLHPDALQARRSYSWRSDSSSKNAPPLYRSRTSYYDLLKVSPGATQSQIKTAYYKQSFIYHPDKNPGNTEASQRFSEISEAYTVLGNISLRRKYDRGILSRSDVQSAGRPSSKETTSRSTGSPHQHQQQQHHQHRARQFSQTGGKPMFDFDAFYQAHYGEQLQRERDLRARKQYVEEQKKKNLGRWREARLMEMTVAMLLAMAGLLLFSLRKP